jgi:hypothetical protein
VLQPGQNTARTDFARSHSDLETTSVPAVVVKTEPEDAGRPSRLISERLPL